MLQLGPNEVTELKKSKQFSQWSGHCALPWWKIKYSSKSLKLPNSFRNGKKFLLPQNQCDFTYVSRLVPKYYLQMIWRNIPPPKHQSNQNQFKVWVFKRHKYIYNMYQQIIYISFPICYKNPDYIYKINHSISGEKTKLIGKSHGPSLSEV